MLGLLVLGGNPARLAGSGRHGNVRGAGDAAGRQCQAVRAAAVAAVAVPVSAP